MKKEADMVPHVLLAIALLATSVTGAADPGEGPVDGLRVFVSIPPQQYVVDRIGGAHVATEVLIAPGQSPHSFDATPKQMVALAESRVYFAIGLPFERELLSRIAELNPDLVIVDMGRGVPRRSLDRHPDDQSEHGHGAIDPASGGHDRGDTTRGLTDPHIWLAPRLVRIQARNVLDALVDLDPAHADDYRTNLERLLADLNDLDAEITEVLAPVRGRTVYVFHPAFGYLTDAYGLNQVAVETGGSEPSARELARLIERAGRDSVRVIFVQPQFAAKSAEAVAREIGGAVVPIDPLAYDWLTNLRDMAARIREALEHSRR